MAASPKKQQNVTPVGSWKLRRRVIYGTLLFSAWVVAYCLVKHLESRVAETAIMGAFALAGGVVGSYVFGATWDDANRRASGEQPEHSVVPPKRGKGDFDDAGDAFK